MEPSTPIIIAHRGLHGLHPENSIAAFRAAARSGIEWVEFDVQQSIDGFPVIIHDDKLERTTSMSGGVDRRRADELVHLRLRNREGRPGDATMPVLLATQINPFAGLNANLLVEIKPPDAATLVQRTAQAMRVMHRRWIIQSFDRTNLRHARRISPTVERAWLIDRPRDLLFAFDQDVSAVHVSFDLISAELVKRIHSHGMSIGAWTVNEPADLRRMIAMGVDRIITDQPILARSLLQDE